MAFRVRMGMRFKMRELSIPILPIPEVVFFPHTSLPLLVAEPAYTEMIRNCVESGTDIGIAMAEPVQTFVHHTKYVPHKIGTLGTPTIVEQFHDGTLKIMIEGVGRIQLEKIERNMPFPVCQVNVLPDFREQEAPFNVRDTVKKLGNILNHWASETVLEPGQRRHFMEMKDDPHHITDYLSMFLVRDSEMRQMLLENRSLYDRIQILNSLFQEGQTYCEDYSALRAMKNYECLEKTYKVSH